MGGIVRDHALRNIWCTPNQDRVVMVNMTKISPAGGAFLRAKVMWETLDLPTPDYYHVFQIGQAPISLFNLPDIHNSWVSAVDMSASRDMVMRIFAQNGLVYPLGLCYFRVTRDNNFVIAAKAVRDFPLDLNTTNVWLYLYSNAFFRSERWTALKTTINKPNAECVKYIYAKIDNQTTLSDFHQAVVDAIANSAIDEARTIFTINGKYSNYASAVGRVSVGDYIEAIIDSSIREIRKVPLEEIYAFTSTLDTRTKRLFPPVLTVETIDFIDDVDFYIVNSGLNGINENGLYFNQLNDYSVRMVTHNAYSLDNIQLGTMVTSELDLYGVALVRHAGYRRPLVLESMRIRELYKLDFIDVVGALVGTPSNLPEWRASTLEASSYMKVISSDPILITDEDVENTYGYNLTASIFCNAYPDIYVDSGNKVFNRPLGLEKYVITTYNNGMMLKTVNGSPGGIIPIPEPSANVSIVELTPGKLADISNPMRWYGTPIVTHTTDIRNEGYRLYICDIINGVPNDQWSDVTGENYHSFSNDGKTLSWDMAALSNANLYPLLIIGGEVNWTQIDITNTFDGNFSFEVIEKVWYSPTWPQSGATQPVIVDKVIRVPTGSFDLFMAGESLIEGVDYKVDWPFVVICKKPGSQAQGMSEVTYRAYGFCKDDLNREDAREEGFVEGGTLSVNRYRNLRDDRNIRIVVNGKCLKRTEVEFAEDGQSLVNTALNGKPYAITDVVMSVDGFTDKETYAFRALSLDIDQRVGDYMTVYDPGTPPPDQNPIVAKYDLISPFCSTIIYRLANENWLDGELDGDYDNIDIATWLTDIVHLTAFDPCLDTTLDLRYLYIRPHFYDTSVALTSDQYRFVERVIKNYLVPAGYPARLDLSAYVTIQD